MIIQKMMMMMVMVIKINQFSLSSSQLFFFDEVTASYGAVKISWDHAMPPAKVINWVINLTLSFYSRLLTLTNQIN